jgi:hypothetical protein
MWDGREERLERKGQHIEVKTRRRMGIDRFGREGRKDWRGRDERLRWRREQEWGLKDLGRKGGKIGAEGTKYCGGEGRRMGIEGFGTEGRKDWIGRDEILRWRRATNGH